MGFVGACADFGRLLVFIGLLPSPYPQDYNSLEVNLLLLYL